MTADEVIEQWLDGDQCRKLSLRKRVTRRQGTRYTLSACDTRKHSVEGNAFWVFAGPSFKEAKAKMVVAIQEGML